MTIRPATYSSRRFASTHSSACTTRRRWWTCAAAMPSTTPMVAEDTGARSQRSRRARVARAVPGRPRQPARRGCVGSRFGDRDGPNVRPPHHRRARQRIHAGRGTHRSVGRSGARSKPRRRRPSVRAAVFASAAWFVHRRGDLVTARELCLEALRDGLPEGCPSPEMAYFVLAFTAMPDSDVRRRSSTRRIEPSTPRTPTSSPTGSCGRRRCSCSW